MEIQENKNLAELTTFRVGGPARFCVEVSSTAQALEALNWAKEKGLKVFVLGGGSNILVSDSGFDGLVIHNKIPIVGENWDDVVVWAIEKHLGGIECLSGIPGSAGGAVVQNIGAYGQTLADVVDWIDAIEVDTLEKRRFKKEECEFEYRNSLFKKSPGKYIIIGFKLKLKRSEQGVAIYPDVIKHFEENKINPTLANVRQAVLEIRNSKGMLVMPGFDHYLSAGSFFKNPIVDKLLFEKVKVKLEPQDNRTWFWEQANGLIKVSAARIVLAAGFSKGQVEGNVGISPKQPLAIINLGKASAAEIKTFARKIKTKVNEKFGIELDEEIIYVGHFIS